MPSPNALSLFGIPRRREIRVPKALASSTVLTEDTRKCLQRLAAYKPLSHGQDVTCPLSRSAAVLVALFVGRSGDLYVLLSRRAETLRTFPGDTSLPGGRYEPGDRTLEDTARREAFEEVCVVDRRFDCFCNAIFLRSVCHEIVTVYPCYVTFNHSLPGPIYSSHLSSC